MATTTPTELPDVLAVGAWLKNAALRLSGGTPHASVVHGDLSDPGACVALEASVQALLNGSPRRVNAVAHDLHPDFYSTRLALRLAEELGIPAIGVQHHHAHIAAVLAEHAMDGPVIGLALDGVGMGTDGQAWGGELLQVQTRSWTRLGHLEELALPGGDVAAREPWRMAAAALHRLGEGAQIGPRFAPLVGANLAQGVQRMLARDIHCPKTSSAGRWFDAAAAALGLSVRQSHEAQAAVALERCAARWLALDRPLTRPATELLTAHGTLDPGPLVAALLDTAAAQVDEAAAWFHVELASALSAWAAAAARRSGIDTVCLGGGCFLNAVLTDHVTRSLQRQGLRVLRPLAHSCGDAGIAWGQAWVAAHRMRATIDAPRALESSTCA